MVKIQDTSNDTKKNTNEIKQTSKPTYYLTTPIYYPSGKLHLGNAYTTIACDSIARYKRSMGYDVFYLTGTDEHGLKIEEKAKELGTSPQKYVDKMANEIQGLWENLDISNDKFIRTTDKQHEQIVQNIFETLLKKGDIYLDKYTGWYSVSDEEYVPESQLKDIKRDNKGTIISGKAPSGHEVVKISEESYFFKMSKYRDWLLDYYQAHPNFIQPASRMKEMINNFLKPGLEDLAISRTTFKWGIPVRSNPKHVIYVWFDALCNYISALGYDTNDDKLFKKLWPANLQMVGKEIVRFHAIYWPIFLHALDLPEPAEIYGHGWLLMKDGKMSKSTGNVIYPEVLVNRYGLDAVRYYLLRSMPYAGDGIFTPEDFVTRINADLSNDLGNLLSRTLAMINKYRNGVTPTFVSGGNPKSQQLEQLGNEVIKEYKQHMNTAHLADALQSVWKLVRSSNKYIEDTSPWELAKRDNKASQDQLNQVLSHLAASLRVIALLISAAMPNATMEIFRQLGLNEFLPSYNIVNLTVEDLPKNRKVIPDPTPIFPRVDMDVEVAFINQQMTQDEKKKGRSQKKLLAQKNQVLISDFDPMQTKLKMNKPEITIEEFDKVDLRIAQIKAVSKVKGSKKLLKFRVAAGDAGDRQIISGISPWYPNYNQLVGKKIIIVANLKPRKLMGLISQGMILSVVKNDENVQLVIVDNSLPVGSNLE